MPLFIIFLFTPLNTSNSHLVKELDIYNIDNKIIKDAFKEALFFTDFLGFLPKG